MVTDFQFTITDEDGDESTTTISFPDGLTRVAIDDIGQTMATLVDAIIAGRTEKVQACLNVDISGLLGNAGGSEADVEEVGYFVFRSSAGYAAEVNIPTIDENLTLAGTDELDLTNADIAAFVTAMEDGLTPNATLVQPSDIGGSDIDSLVFAREAFRNSGSRR